jgi:methionyl-tRNA formyltransferase
MKNRHFSVLFVGDPHLGESGLRIVCRRFANTTGIIWKRGDAQQREEIRNVIRSRKWDMLISFYNDLIFQEADLAQVSLPLNIHPSLPSLRGVAYDALPLIEGHKICGATLHLMTREIDAGKILDILEAEIPKGITGKQFRLLTQALCKNLLKNTVEYLSVFDDIPSVYLLLSLETRHQYVNWGFPYFSRKMLNEQLEDIKQRNPDHCVFR